MESFTKIVPRILWKVGSFYRKGGNGLPNIYYLSSRYQSYVSHKLMYTEYGDPVKVIKRGEDYMRPPQKHDVIVRMLAAPVNPADINTIQGVYPIKPPLPAVGGNEGVGEVVAVGHGVRDFARGDRVLLASPGLGSWRSYIVCKGKDLMKVPQELGVVEAATLSVNPCSAFRMLRDFMALKPGDTVIQNGSNGSVGQNVIQLCKAWGVNTVNIVRNRDNIEELTNFLIQLGASTVLIEEEVRDTDIFKSKLFKKPMLALNCVGGKNALQMLRHIDNKGMMVTYGGMSREPITIPTSALVFKDITLKGFWMTRWVTNNANNEQRTQMLEEIIQMMINGKLKPSFHKLVPFNEFEEALLNTMTFKGFTGLKYILSFPEPSKPTATTSTTSSTAATTGTTDTTGS